MEPTTLRDPEAYQANEGYDHICINSSGIAGSSYKTDCKEPADFFVLGDVDDLAVNAETQKLLYGGAKKKTESFDNVSDKSDKLEEFVNIVDDRFKVDINLDLPVYGIIFVVSLVAIAKPDFFTKAIPVSSRTVRMTAGIIALLSAINLGLIVLPMPSFSVTEGMSGGGNGSYESKLNWKHKVPKQALDELVARLGPPSYVVSQPGGVAVWNSENLENTCFEAVELRDEYISHSKPKKHYDYLYTYVKFEIPQEKVYDILKLSESISYDALKHLLRARCATLEANNATLYLATEIARGRVSIKNVIANDLYKKELNASKSKERAREHYRRLCNNVSS